MNSMILWCGTTNISCERADGKCSRLCSPYAVLGNCSALRGRENLSEWAELCDEPFRQLTGCDLRIVVLLILVVDYPNSKLVLHH